jgi:drug/metabolite transporter (DMT)-like permease
MQGEGNPLKGVGLAVLATLFFATGDTLSKVLAATYTVGLILFLRYAINLALVAAAMAPRHGAAMWRTRRLGLVVLRGVCLALASLSMLLALRVMPVAETVAIIYITPVLVVLFSALLLGERVGTPGWIGVALGFCGVFLIARPGSGLDPWGIALSLVNAALGTVFHLLSRVLTRTETTMAMMLYTALVGTVVFAIVILFAGPGPLPAVRDAGLIFLLAALSTLGHLLLTSAYREAPASILAPANYLHIAFATGLGWLVFRQVPDALGFAGMGLITAAGLIAAWRASR